MKTVSVLGATGSIGDSTLDVVARHPDHYRIHTLSAHRNADKLLALARWHRPEVVALSEPDVAAGFEARLRSAGLSCRLAVGADELAEVAGTPGVDCVMAAIVGAAGLAPTLAAARHARALLLANKESIVMAGHLFMSVCRQSGVQLLPVDSEHNAVFQCLPDRASGLDTRRVIRRLILTASGGPFRTWSAQQIATATPDQACKHPNWSMGRKISVDSATMMNKGLELIEAHFLFDVPPAQLDVLIHPQSIVHSMVEYRDGSVLAQMGNPDMRVPIAHALAYPERVDSGAAPLDLLTSGGLQFEAPDDVRFPCLRLAREAMRVGGGAPCVLNAANEVSVQGFLDGELGFADIARINERVLTALGDAPAPASLVEAVELDVRARRQAALLIKG
ncbi:MAG: 1-deoxy-D-xylulose-5-phosphate reductoisomerase [Lautropia sp.]|nr:1-deoxy-D-xylulose-5-phosphate reductoisomerase [Lautropia sp.]